MAVITAPAHDAGLIEFSQFAGDDGGERIDGGFELAVLHFLHLVQFMQVLIVPAGFFLELGVLFVNECAVVDRALIQRLVDC